MNDILFAILIFLYGASFFADTFVFSYPSKIYNGQKAIGIIFNTQKKLSFLVRIAVNITYPLAAYLVDVSYISSENAYFILYMMIAAIVGVIFSKPMAPRGEPVEIDKRLKIGSWFYIFHFIGIPLSIIVAPIFHDYRATIIQLGVVLNTISVISQVWLVDNRLSSLLTEETLVQLKAEVYSVWFYRVVTKVLGAAIFLCVILYWY